MGPIFDVRGKEVNTIIGVPSGGGKKGEEEGRLLSLSISGEILEKRVAKAQARGGGRKERGRRKPASFFRPVCAAAGDAYTKKWQPSVFPNSGKKREKKEVTSKNRFSGAFPKKGEKEGVGKICAGKEKKKKKKKKEGGERKGLGGAVGSTLGSA